MTRISHPTTIPYPYPQSPVNPSAPQPGPDPHALKQPHTLLSALDATLNAAQPRQQPPKASLFHPYLPQASLTLADPHPVASLERQGSHAALALLAEGRLSKAPLRAALTEHADTPQVLAGFFTALGPENTLEALLCLDPHERDGINPSGYAPVVAPARGRLWESNIVEAFHRKEHRAQQESLATALSNAVTGGLSETFMQELAAAASATPRAANSLSQLLIRSDDAALLPLKAALFNTLMTPQKALNPDSNDDTRGWVRAATLLLGNEANGQWLARLQDAVGHKGLSQFTTTAVQHTVDKKLDGYSYGDEDYQRGLEGMLRGLAQLEGQAYTALKAHIFSAACDAMGEVYTRAALTEGLKAVFGSDPKGVAMEIMFNSNSSISNPAAFSFFFKETIFNNSDSKGEFIKTVSSTLKDLYQDATDSSLSESQNEKSSMTLGVLFGSLRAAFNDAKADNKADQDAVRNMVNVLTGFATIFPEISIGLAAAKDGIVVPFLSDLFNSGNRAQAEEMDLINDKFYEILRVMFAGFNGYQQNTGRKIGGAFDGRFSRVQSASDDRLKRH